MLIHLKIFYLAAEQNISQSLSEGNFTDQCQFERDSVESRVSLAAVAGKKKKSIRKYKTILAYKIFLDM